MNFCRFKAKLTGFIIHQNAMIGENKTGKKEGSILGNKQSEGHPNNTFDIWTDKDKLNTIFHW